MQGTADYGKGVLVDTMTAAVVLLPGASKFKDVNLHTQVYLRLIDEHD
jgi:hypothetical protein